LVTAVPSRGFTLIELMVVLAVLALLLTVAVPFFPKALPGAEIKGAARELAAGLRTARSRAITLNREVGFTLDVEGRRGGTARRDDRRHSLLSRRKLHRRARQLGSWGARLSCGCGLAHRPDLDS
jgi:type II secretion system protein H